MLGNSIRLRLSQTDMETLAAEDRILNQVDFGTAALQYGIEITDGNSITATLEDHVLLVGIPRSLAKPWIETEQVGISHTIASEGSPEMAVLLEKDFACLVPRPDEQDLFPNPDAGSGIR